MTKFTGTRVEQLVRRVRVLIAKNPFHISIPLLIFRPLIILLCAATPGIVMSQNSHSNGRPEGTVQAQMHNVTYHFSDALVVEIKSLNGELVPLGKNEFPIFDD